jgi:pSer/pThr/pTyr-binding forkhead associated (FHA) protein
VTRIVIGRDPSCDVVVDDLYASPRHAAIMHEAGMWWVRDLGSTNGTHLDGCRLRAPTPFGRAATIRVGRTDLKAADLLPTAVAELHALVTAEGYRQDDVDALQLLAESGRTAEEAAQLVLTAKRRGANPLGLARALRGTTAR